MMTAPTSSSQTPTFGLGMGDPGVVLSVSSLIGPPRSVGKR